MNTKFGQFPYSIKTPKKLLLGFKVLFFCISIAYIVYSCSQNQSLIVEFWKTLYKFLDKSLIIFLYVLFLMPFNWGIEALKWQIVVKKSQNINFLSSYKLILKVVSWSIIIPRALADFILKLKDIPSNDRIKISSGISFNKITQLGITFWAGIFSVLYLFDFEFFHNKIQVISIIISVLSITSILVFVIFRKNKFVIEFTTGFREISLKDKFNLVALSLMRYGIFMGQYLLILNTFDTSFDIIELSAIVSFVFFCKSIFVSFGSLAELSIRESSGLFIAHHLSFPQDIVLTSGLIIYFVNIVIPAIVGSFLNFEKK